VLVEPIDLAWCRDCVGEETPPSTCWKFRGQMLYRSEANEADFVFGLHFDGSALGFGMETTERMRAWLVEVGAE
jgi:hypothetical protein